MHAKDTGLVLLAIVLTAGWLGCNSSTKDDLAKPAGAGTASGQAAQAEPAPAPQPEPPPKPTMPEVKLTEALAATCLVKVGDAMPEVTLPDLTGAPTAFRSLSGEKLTVVCFWKADHPYAVEELRDLQKSVAGPYQAKGVRVVAINQADSPEVARQTAQQTGAAFPILLDADGAYFQKVATQGLPRTYLLDAEGKILWFDIEYSRSTERNLLQAIDVTLEKE